MADAHRAAPRRSPSTSRAWPGPRAALPHGSPGAAPVAAGEVLLFDFGAQVAGYRSDMTRTLFVGEPRRATSRSTSSWRGAQAAAIDALERGRRCGAGRRVRQPDVAIDAVARDVIEAAGHGDHFGHGLGHGIGLATHELPSLGAAPRGAAAVADGLLGRAGRLPRRRDRRAHRGPRRCSTRRPAALERLTLFPREVTVVGLDRPATSAGHIGRLDADPSASTRRAREEPSPHDLDRRTARRASPSSSTASSGRSSTTTTSRWAAARPRSASSCATSSAARPWSAPSRPARSGRAPSSRSARSSSSTATATTYHFMDTDSYEQFVADRRAARRRGAATSSTA